MENLDAVVYGKVNQLEAKVNELEAKLDQTAKLVEINQQIVVPADGSTKASFAVGFDKFELRTVFTENITNTNSFVVKIYDKATDGFAVFESHQNNLLYDILNIPSSDKDGTQKVHVEIFNKGTTQATFHLVLKITSLR